MWTPASKNTKLPELSIETKSERLKLWLLVGQLCSSSSPLPSLAMKLTVAAVSYSPTRRKLTFSPLLGNLLGSEPS